MIRTVGLRRRPSGWQAVIYEIDANGQATEIEASEPDLKVFAMERFRRFVQDIANQAGEE